MMFSGSRVDGQIGVRKRFSMMDGGECLSRENEIRVRHRERQLPCRVTSTLIEKTPIDPGVDARLLCVGIGARIRWLRKTMSKPYPDLNVIR